MKKKTGFTLIELIVTLSIVSTVLIISVIGLNKIRKRKKEEAYKLVINEVMTAAKQYFDSNEYLFEGLGNKAKGIISVGKLIKEDYINVVINPITGKELNKCDQVEVSKNNNKYSTKFVKSKSTKCETNNSIIVKEFGAPLIETSFYSFNDSNNQIKLIEGKNWYNSKDLPNSYKVMVKVTTKEDGNGPILSIIVNGNKLNKEIYANKYDDKDNFSFDGKNLNASYIAVNSNGKKAISYVSANVDKTVPVTSVDYDNNKWVNENVSYTVNASDNLSLKNVKFYWNKNGLSENDSNLPSYKWDIKNEYYGNATNSYNDLSNNIVNNNLKVSSAFKAEGLRKGISKACDEAGNCTYSNEMIARIDNTKPTCSINASGSTKGNKVNGIQWYIKSHDLKVNMTYDDYLSGINKKSINNVNTNNTTLKNGIKTFNGYVEDVAGNYSKCNLTVGHEEKATLTFDKYATNNDATSIRKSSCKKDKHNPNGQSIYKENGYKYGDDQNIVNNLTPNNKPCKFGECSDIKCRELNKGKWKQCNKDYFSRSCMYVSSFRRYFIANSVSGGYDLSLNTYKESNNGKYEDYKDKGKLYYEGKKKSGGAKRNSTQNGYCLINSEYDIDNISGTKGLYRDDYKYESPAGNESNTISLVVEYVAKCGYYDNEKCSLDYMKPYTVNGIKTPAGKICE